MTIESPETYGDHYWNSQFEAAKTFEEEMEKSIKPFIPSIFDDPEIRAAMPFDILQKLEGLFAFDSPGLAGVGGRFVSEIADQAVMSIMSPALRKVTYQANRRFSTLRVTPDMSATLFRRRKVDEDFLKIRMLESGYDEFESKIAYNASSPFPTLPELFRWARYHGEPNNIWGTLFEEVDLDPVDFPKWDWLSRQQLSTDQITSLFRRGITSIEALPLALEQVGWTGDNINTIKELSWLVPNAMLLIQGNLFAVQEKEKIFEDIGHADIHPDYRQIYYDAVLTKPASIDLVAYHLRQENQLSELEADLRKIGIHPDYFKVYKKLADRLPPISDIITMAVRETFTPSIAARFGQYEDFPADFEKYAQQQGLSKEWAERYWAAHWGLPSPQQGFEMLHRGVIDKNDLQLLMKAQDIMPFWRGKMTAIAFRPLTRVDVRRMYKEGILDESGVYKAYLDAGYDEDNAENMTEFTLAFVLSQQSKFKTGDVIKAYTTRMIDRSEARNLLDMLGVRSEDISYIIDTADYKKEWALTESKTKAIHNLYRRGEYTENKTRSELLRLDLPSDQVNVLMEQWWFERKEDGVTTWTKAETFKFVKQELITPERGRQELLTMGYDNEHIDIYLRSLQWQRSTE